MGIAQRADLIARTELATSFIQGKMSRYREMGYDHVRWSAAGERTCGFCASRDGLVFPGDRERDPAPALPLRPHPGRGARAHAQGRHQA